MYSGGVICLSNIRYDKNSVVCISEGYCFYIEMFARYLPERQVCTLVDFFLFRLLVSGTPVSLCDLFTVIE